MPAPAATTVATAPPVAPPPTEAPAVPPPTETPAITNATPPAEPVPATPAAAPELSAEVSGPNTAEIATRIDVSWKGPANQDDYISIARPDQPPGVSDFQAPSLSLLPQFSPTSLWP